MNDWDVLIIGRSYAGLSAALNLGRARRSVLLAGSGEPRNASVGHVHGWITRDGAAPADLVAEAERELERYPTIQLVDGRVTDLTATSDGFAATVGGRTTSATLVILATGANDDPPAVPGLADHWGRGVFTCPYCDGFEHADGRLAVTGDPDHAAHLGRLLTAWSDDVTVVADLDDATAADLRDHGVAVDARGLERVVGDGNGISALRMSDSEEVPTDALFLAQLPIPNSALAVDLGCAVDDLGFVVVDASRRTSVDGVWAIGDVANRRANMALAVADGVLAATDCHALLHLGAH